VNPQAKDKSRVWVWAEHHQEKPAKVSLGLLGKAHELCQQLGGGEVTSVLVGTDSQQLVAELIDHGSDKVYLASDPCLSPFEIELCAHLMTRLIQNHQPEIVLWGATSMGREIASRVAAKLDTGLTAHCVDLCIEKVDFGFQFFEQLLIEFNCFICLSRHTRNEVSLNPQPRIL